MRELLVGLDLGTTSFKAVACDLSGRQLSVGRVGTPWGSAATGVTMTPQAVLSAADHALELCLREHGDAAVISVGVTGMAEAGYIVDPAGIALTPAYSWLNSGGANEAADLESTFGSDTFSSRTGLALTTRCSAVKSRWVRNSHELTSLNTHWQSLPEWVVQQWGGADLSEFSLSARTGLLNVSTREWDQDLVAWSGFEPTLMPRLSQAGASWGSAVSSHPRVPNATLTVAGHDHVCASIGTGATNLTDALDSLGTGEAVIRSTNRLDEAAILNAVNAGVSVGVHVLSERMSLVIGLGTGDRLTRVAQALGMPPGERAELDLKALHERFDRHSRWAIDLVETGEGSTERVQAGDEARVWRTALEVAAHRCRDALNTLSTIVGNHDRLFATGGWFASPGFSELREMLLGRMVIRPKIEAAGLGAALLAGVAHGVYPSSEALPTRQMEDSPGAEI